MNKYNPDESITCPKCGRENAPPLGPVYDSGTLYDGPTMKFNCLCGFEFKRRPLDYEGGEGDNED